MSTPPAAGRDLNGVLAELGAVLQAAARSPVVLVGHSIGGLLAYEFARRFPEGVCGLVLLDASHPAQMLRFAARSSAVQQTGDAEEQAWMLAEHPERPDLRALLAREGVAVPGSLADLPTAVVSRGRALPLERARQARPDLTEVQHQGRIRVWGDLQAEYARASSQSRHLQAGRSGHYVYLDEPELVLGAVREVWEAARKRHPVYTDSMTSAVQKGSA